MRIATIDIGTNTTLLLVAERNEQGIVKPLAERAEITRLGRGIGGDGLLRAENVARTLEVLREYTREAQTLQAPVFAIGTEGLRRAPNAQDFLQPAATILGTPVEVISGDREAHLTFLAAQRSFPVEAEGDVVVIDIGGGSTEIIIANAANITYRQSLPLGSVRLTEAFIQSDPPQAEDVDRLEAHVRQTLASVPFPVRGTLIGTAGTVTTLAAMAQELRDYDPAAVHGFRLSRQALHEQRLRLRAATQAEREQMAGLDPRRADVVFAGATLLAGIVEQAGAAAVLVSDRGIRWGLAFDQFDNMRPATVPPGEIRP